MKKKSKKSRKKSIPQNIGQYLYKNQYGALENLFPKKSMKDIRKIIKWKTNKVKQGNKSHTSREA